MNFTQSEVDESLNNAVENDYDIKGIEAWILAEDLADYDAKYEGASEEDLAKLEALVQNWKDRNPE